jgi:hypothetical protein
MISTGVFGDETKWDGSFAKLARQRGVHGITIENVLVLYHDKHTNFCACFAGTFLVDVREVTVI